MNTITVRVYTDTVIVNSDSNGYIGLPACARIGRERENSLFSERTKRLRYLCSMYVCLADPSIRMKSFAISKRNVDFILYLIIPK